MKIKVLGCDPAMQNVGLVNALVDLDTFEVGIQSLVLIKTASDKTKQVRKNSDDVRRAGEIYTRFLKATSEVSMVIAEVPVGSQSARAMASYGMCCMMLAACPKPLIQVNPTEVKLAMTGIKTASKDEMIKAAIAKYPNAGWLMKTQKGRTWAIDDNEHLADAVGTILAGVKTEQFKQAVAMYRGMIA